MNGMGLSLFIINVYTSVLLGLAHIFQIVSERQTGGERKEKHYSLCSLFKKLPLCVVAWNLNLGLYIQ